MTYTDAELRQLGLDQLTPFELARARLAFHGFEYLLGRNWLDAICQGTASRSLVLYICCLWETWSLVASLNRSDQLPPRWKAVSSREAVSTEVLTIGRLITAGRQVELFPTIESRTPDARFTDENGEWIYVEVSRRGESESLQHSRRVLQATARAAMRLAPKRHGKIGLRRAISENEVRQLLDWLTSLTVNEDVYSFGDMAVCHATDLQSAVDDHDPSVLCVPEPRYFITSLVFAGQSVTGKGTAVMCVEDFGAAEMLESEASQLPKDGPGVVILDISEIPGGIKQWSPLVRRRLQPGLNRRISAVVLVSTTLDDDGLKRTGEVIANPYSPCASVTKQRRSPQSGG